MFTLFRHDILDCNPCRIRRMLDLNFISVFYVSCVLFLHVITLNNYFPWSSLFWGAGARVTSSKVDQFPIVLHEAVGGNVSIFCKYHILQVIPDVHWWRESENAFIRPDSRKQFNINKGSGSFTLLNVNIADSGKYYCHIKQQQQPLGNGSGTLLAVFGKYPFQWKSMLSSPYHGDKTQWSREK